MNRQTLLVLAAAACIAAVGTSAQAGLFGKGGCCPPATCEPATCEPATCEPATCEPACCEPRCGLFARLKARLCRPKCCEPVTC
ncbi:MAG TPA: keratin-like protein, partial [Planctomycetaceae bacterium]|nr:keratin-like protein [Planctomycetaceae bacterium]